MTYSYDRREAARRKVPVPPAPSPPAPPAPRKATPASAFQPFLQGDPDDVEQVIEDMDRVLHRIVWPTIKAAMKTAKDIKPSQQEDSFSDGLHLRQERDALGYAFTIHYPSSVEVTFVAKLDLGPLLLDLLKAAQRGRVTVTDPSGLDHALKAIDWDRMVQEEVDDTSLANNEDDLDEEVRINIESRLEQDIRQSIEAYSHDGNVELGEYPGVYLEWSLRNGGFTAKTRKVGDTIELSLHTLWKSKPKAWQLGSSGRGGWNRL